jgi:hypothetical protein
VSELPPYTYVPGGRVPHPISDPRGHSHGETLSQARPIVGDAWHESPDYLRGVALFNAGFYWEAHEAWERLWHAHGRTGPVADVLQALIKLAAAGVKVRQGQPRGVATHARRAAEALRRIASTSGPRRLGLDLEELTDTATRIADRPPSTDLLPEAPAAPVLGLILPGPHDSRRLP